MPAVADWWKKDELFLPGQPPYGRTFTIESLSLGYIYDFARLGSARVGVGGLLSLYRYPSELDAAYGEGPVSYMLFMRVRI